jgi:hypothetical protein
MADRVGQQLGNYRLVRLLGKGGFSEGYLGEHVRLRTQAAIKILLSRLANPDEIENFQKEAETIAHLSHPHIVRVLDFDVIEDTPFLVMDYAPDGTLRQRHPRGSQLSPEQTLPYVQQVGDALQYAHDEKLIHRDIKPENILLGQRNQVLLSDFGISTIAHSSRYQNTQEVIGTAAYMAPEQLQGKPRPASDQYALGIVLYEWLAGSRPFSGSFTELYSQQLFVPPPPLREKLPTLSLGLEQVVMTTLEKDPRARFASMQAFVKAFETACQEAGLLSAPTARYTAPLSSSQSLVAPTPTPPPLPGSSQPLPALPPTVAVPPARRPSGEAPATPGPARISAPIPAQPATFSLAAPPAPAAPAQPAAPAKPEEAGSIKRRLLRPSLLITLVLLIVLGSAVGVGLVWLKSSSSTNSATTPQNGSFTPTPLPVIGSAIYAGLTVAINGVDLQPQFNEYQPNDPSRNVVVKVDLTINNKTGYDVEIDGKIRLSVINGPPEQKPGLVSQNVPMLLKDQASFSSSWFFDVPTGSTLKDCILVLGSDDEAVEYLPLTGAIDASPWQQKAFSFPAESVLSLGKNVQITLKKGVVGIWVPGFQAPSRGRFLQMMLQARNSGTGAVTLDGNQFILRSGSTQYVSRPSPRYDPFTTVPAPPDAQVHDLGTLTYVIPKMQLDFVLELYDQSGNQQLGSVDLGTL